MIPHQVQVFAFKQLQLEMKVGAKILKFREPLLFTGPGSSLQLCDHIGIRA